MNTDRACAACQETVYPFEVIRCFDQIWHRKCFRCQHCGMALSICNYHGFDKKPYCAAHSPKPTSFTLVTDTPELLRVANNTRMFSSANNIRSGRSSGFDERYSPQSFRQGEVRTGSAPYNNHYGSSVTPPPNRFGINNHCTSPHTFPSSAAFPPANNNTGNAVMNNNGNVGSSETINIPRGSTLNLNFHNHSSQTRDGPNNSGFGGTFIAQYSYEAKDDDEVTFKPGDVIVNGQPISEGWMYGTVQRTGQFGMLPSNYVKLHR
ncbi:unnamed protein product [Heterobilharzia americana]|nr:unnamed protein product [Heterobilharzia americana]